MLVYKEIEDILNNHNPMTIEDFKEKYARASMTEMTEHCMREDIMQVIDFEKSPEVKPKDIGIYIHMDHNTRIIDIEVYNKTKWEELCLTK